MDSKVESPPSFLSLPDEILVNCIARISRSYYPKLSLVSKTFRSLVSSKKLSDERSHLGTTEYFFHICLKFQPSSGPSWYTLWIKPDQTLTNDLVKKEGNNKCSGNTLLVRIPSPYSPSVPAFVFRTPSECYEFSQNIAPSPTTAEWKNGVICCRTHMTLVGESPVVDGVVYRKVYVMEGGMPQRGDWAESLGQTLEHDEDYVYDPERSRWNHEGSMGFMKRVMIEDVFYTYDCRRKNLLWCHAPHSKWRKVRGLGMLDSNFTGAVFDIANYYGKLLIFWERFARIGRCQDHNRNIWCALIAFERRNDGQVWGNIEWASLEFTSTRSFDFVRCRVNKV